MQTSPEVEFEDGGARLRATIDRGGLATTYYFQWGEISANAVTSPVQLLEAGLEPLVVGVDLVDLKPGDTYHFRVVAGNALGNAVSADQRFTAPFSLPELSSVSARRLDTTTATLIAAVNPNGSPAVWSFEYGLTRAYGTETSGGLLPAEARAVEVSEQLLDLQPGCSYHCRLVVRRADEIYRGEDRLFMTPPERSISARLRAETAGSEAGSVPAPATLATA